MLCDQIDTMISADNNAKGIWAADDGLASETPPDSYGKSV